MTYTFKYIAMGRFPIWKIEADNLNTALAAFLCYLRGIISPSTFDEMNSELEILMPIKESDKELTLISSKEELVEYVKKNSREVIDAMATLHSSNIKTT